MKHRQEVVAALTHSILEGSVGTWGPVPMPAHPQLSEEQAAAAAAYILSVDEQEANLNAPRDASGQPYAATLDYDILPRLTSVHPSFRLDNLAPPGFEPKVGGMAFRDDGKLVDCQLGPGRRGVPGGPQRPARAAGAADRRGTA